MEEIEKIGDIVPLGLRMRSSLKEKIEKVVEEKKRTFSKRWSINSEIVERLEKSFTENLSTGELIDELTRRLGEESVIVKVQLGKDPSKD